MTKRYSKRQLAQAFLQLRSEMSEAKAISAVAAQLIKQGTTGDVDLLVQEIAREQLRQEGELHVTVAAAHAVSAKLEKKIGEILQQRAGATKVVVTQTIDPATQGGFVATSPAGQLDATIASRLKQLAA